jgi:hypothetical protein
MTSQRSEYDAEQIIDIMHVDLVLDKLGKEFTRKKKGQGHELYFDCINPNHVEHTKHVHMSIAESGQYKGLWNCWSCGWRGNVFQLVQIIKQITYGEAIVWVAELAGASTLDSEEMLSYTLRKMKAGHDLNDAEHEILEAALPADYRPIEYQGDFAFYMFLVDRGISAEAMSFFQVGTGSHADLGRSLIIPIYFKQRLRSVFSCEPKTGGKKRYPSATLIGTGMRDSLFNYDEARNHQCVYVVESILDAMKLRSIGIPNAVSCFTNMISGPQLDALKIFDDIIVCPDMDSQYGWVLVDRIVAKFGKGVFLALPSQGKDPGDCLNSELWSVCNNLMQFSDWDVARTMAKTHAGQQFVDTVNKK